MTTDNDRKIKMTTDNDNVVPFPPRRTLEAELPSLWAWADPAARYGYYPITGMATVP